MAWSNPATWTIVDKIQGQNKGNTYARDTGGGGGGGGGGWGTNVGGYTGPGGERGASPLTTTINPISTSYQTLGAESYAQPIEADPYAQWGGRAAFDAKVNAFNTQKQGIFDTSNEAIGATGRSLNSSILDFLDSFKQGQNSINEKAITADQAKLQGGRDITSMISRGIRSSGVNLANKNATDSSAAEGVARAYGDIGQREMNKVGGQYAGAQREIGMDQEKLAESGAMFNRHYGENKTNAIEGIVSNARNSLAALDAQIADASLPDRIAIEQEKEKIRATALSELSRYDTVLSEGMAGVKALTPEQRMAQAAQRSTEGISLGDNAYQYDTQAPLQFQGTGPFASNLPLFTFAGRRREA